MSLTACAASPELLPLRSRWALEINPRHRGAHEYIGEAYLLVGNQAAAERHLAALRSICVLSCDEVRELEKAIADHRLRAGQR